MQVSLHNLGTVGLFANDIASCNLYIAVPAKTLVLFGVGVASDN